jgi:hypothetical protein
MANKLAIEMGLNNGTFLNKNPKMEPSCPPTGSDFLSSVLAGPPPGRPQQPKMCHTLHFAVRHAHTTADRPTIPSLLPRISEEAPLNRDLGLPHGHGRARSISAPSLEFPRIDLMTFDQAMSDPLFTINPTALGFIPHEAWSDQEVPFGQLVMTFFRRRNSMHCKFPYKLFNALLLTRKLPRFFPLVGIRWVTEDIFLVQKLIFAQLLGVRTIDGSLFHQQGNFPSHGFVELSFQEAKQIGAENGIFEVDATNMRFLKHANGGFTSNDVVLDPEQLKWARA